MFTIKYTDADGFERLTEGYDLRSRASGKQHEWVSWLDAVAGQGCRVAFPTTVYVMNDAGSTVGKYVVAP